MPATAMHRFGVGLLAFAVIVALIVTLGATGEKVVFIPRGASACEAAAHLAEQRDGDDYDETLRACERAIQPDD